MDKLKNKRFEYKSVTFNSREIETVDNGVSTYMTQAMGWYGWELVQVVPYTKRYGLFRKETNYRCIFKRRIYE
jgi:hypothetical protein